MPEIEYIEDYKKPNGRVIKKGMRGHVTIEKAKALESEKVAVVVGSESTRNTQERSSIINRQTDESNSSKKSDKKK